MLVKMQTEPLYTTSKKVTEFSHYRSPCEGFFCKLTLSKGGSRKLQVSQRPEGGVRRSCTLKSVTHKEAQYLRELQTICKLRPKVKDIRNEKKKKKVMPFGVRTQKG